MTAYTTNQTADARERSKFRRWAERHALRRHWRAACSEYGISQVAGLWALASSKRVAVHYLSGEIVARDEYAIGGRDE